jgi:succinoglycan biosynthesis protein ExoO
MAMDRASVAQDMTERPRQENAGPDVSFVVAAYNAGPFIEAAIASALAQTGVTIEVIVVDDASSDDTPAIVAVVAAKDPRVTLIRRTSNGGPSVSRNEAMRKARGAWIAVLDADDLIAPERSRRLIDLAETTSADVVGDNFARFSADPEAPSSTMIPAAPMPYYFFVDTAAFLRGNAMFDAAARLGYIKLMFRRAFLENRGIEHLEEVVIGEDYHLGLSCLLEGARFVVSSETLYKYRVRDGSLSWRLRTKDIEQLLRSHDELGIERRFGGDAQVLEAARLYRGSLVTAREVASAIEQAKRGHWQSALTSAAAHPRTWPLLARFAGQAAAKRLGVQ